MSEREREGEGERERVRKRERESESHPCRIPRRKGPGQRPSGQSDIAESGLGRSSSEFQSDSESVSRRTRRAAAFK